MSACNIILHSDAVHVMTDGACFLPSRPLEPFAFAAKAWVMPHLNAVAVNTGPSAFSPLVAQILSFASSFDGILDASWDGLRAAFDQFPDLPDFSVMVAGFSESNGPSAFRVASGRKCSQHRDGSVTWFEPWSAVSLPKLSFVPGGADLSAEVAARIEGAKSADDFDPITDGVWLIERQRASRLAGVGGFVQLTSVTRDGITSRVIHRWPEDVSIMRDVQAQIIKERGAPTANPTGPVAAQ